MRDSIRRSTKVRIYIRRQDTSLANSTWEDANKKLQELVGILQPLLDEAGGTRKESFSEEEKRLQRSVLEKVSGLSMDLTQILSTGNRANLFITSTQRLDESLSRVLELFTHFNSEGGDSAGFYRSLLQTAVELIPEAEYGSISQIDATQWRFISAIGHDIEKLRELKLDPAWEVSQGEGGEINDFHSRDRQTFPPEVFARFQEAVVPIKTSLVASVYPAKDRRISISVDIPAESEQEFSESSRIILSSLASLASSFSRMLSAIGEVQGAYKTIYDLNLKLNKILELTSELSSESKYEEAFYEQLLNTALHLLEEADYGSVSIIEQGHWRFVTAVGHDKETLKKLPLSSKDLLFADQVTIVDDLIEARPNRNSMEDSVFCRLSEATMPIQQTMLITIDIGHGTQINLSLDIRKGSSKRFDENSKRIFGSFATLASSFLKVRLSSESVKRSYLNFAKKLAIVAEAHDEATAAHNERVSRLSEFLAQKYGLSQEMVDEVRTFAPLHDIGKIFLDRDLLNKVDTLTEAEYRVIQEHTIFSKELLADPYFIIAYNIALFHHENYDGSGYPFGLSGDEIPIEAQIVALTDVFDALRTERSYKKSFTVREALAEITSETGRVNRYHFNPQLLQIFTDNIEQIEHEVYGE